MKNKRNNEGERKRKLKAIERKRNDREKKEILGASLLVFFSSCVVFLNNLINKDNLEENIKDLYFPDNIIKIWEND